MSRFRYLLPCLVLTTLVVSAPAGLFFKKQPKPKPEERVPELITTLKGDADEHKRAAAATELRKYDPRAFPAIVPLLIDVLKKDAKPSVRQEAAQSLGRIRPVSPEAGLALEQAAANDAALRVRVQARTSLMYYRLSGYHTPKTDGPQLSPSGQDKGEPPLAIPDAPGKTGPLKPLPRLSGRVIVPTTTAEPPLALPAPDNVVPRPLPPGPVKSALVPVNPPHLETPPPPLADEGPELNPPQ
jgi:hypothetical protein